MSKSEGRTEALLGTLCLRFAIIQSAPIWDGEADVTDSCVITDSSTGSQISTSCCGREVSETRLTWDAAKKYCEDLSKKLAGTCIIYLNYKL